jgi:hypothetical protein
MVFALLPARITPQYKQIREGQGIGYCQQLAPVKIYEFSRTRRPWSIAVNKAAIAQPLGIHCLVTWTFVRGIIRGAAFMNGNEKRSLFGLIGPAKRFDGRRLRTAASNVCYTT